ncbi:MAG TPA: hypothetical protein VNQ77_05635 [Frankiaceae bacterium]|nr:hypothetical protein [Frankiaceae bacterium]
MLIRGEAERVAGLLSGIPEGLAFAGVRVPGPDGDEIDALVLTPRRAVTITVHDPPRPTSDLAGETRARVQRLRRFCAENDLDVGVIPAVAVIAGDADQPPREHAGGVWTTGGNALPAVLAGLPSAGEVTRADVRRLLALLGLGAPDEHDLDAARFRRADGSEPAPAPIPDAPYTWGAPRPVAPVRWPGPWTAQLPLWARLVLAACGLAMVVFSVAKSLEPDEATPVRRPGVTRTP